MNEAIYLIRSTIIRNESERQSTNQVDDQIQKMTLRLPVLAFLFCFILNGCGTDHSASGSHGLYGKLVVTGSSTLAPLASEMAKRFEELHPGVRIDVQTGGSGKGISDARNGIADIGMASRALKDVETKLVSHQIAADGVGLILNSENPIGELSKEQVVDIYLGKYHNWSDLGGPDLEITVVHKAEGRATLEVFLERFDLFNPDVQPDVIVGDNEHGIKTVSGLAGAIGYVSIGTAEANIENSVPIKLLPLNGIEANSANVASGNFPLSRPLIFVTTAAPSELVNSFIEFCKSGVVQDLVASQYFVSV